MAPRQTEDNLNGAGILCHTVTGSADAITMRGLIAVKFDPQIKGKKDIRKLRFQVFKAPDFQFAKFNLQAILVIIPATLVVVSEHIGHQVVTSEVVGKDLLKDPGLHRSMFADGFSTALSGLVGSCPTTTYGENIGVMAITKVYSVWVIGGAAAFSIVLSFIGKASALIQTIPGPVMGGVSFLLYGMIGASGIRLMVDAKIDYSKARNLALTSVVFVVGLSGVAINLGQVQLSGMSLAAVVGMVLGFIMYLLDKYHLTNEYEDGESESKLLDDFKSSR